LHACTVVEPIPLLYPVPNYNQAKLDDKWITEWKEKPYILCLKEKKNP